MRRVYSALLRLYPEDHKVLFGAEMLRVFEQAEQEQRERGGAALARLAFDRIRRADSGSGSRMDRQVQRRAERFAR